MEPIYLDYNATTPVDKEVADAMRPYLESIFGNPSSNHPQGYESRMAVEKAREQVAQLINAAPDEIVFTSGGSESNNYAIKGAALANKASGRHIITSSVEHPAVSEVCRYLETQGFEVTYLPVDDQGRVTQEQLQEAIRSDTILISIMHANNEVGTIQDIVSLRQVASRSGILFHTDAAQSAGKIPVDVKKMDVDLLSLAGHKLYAPKGIGALYIRRGVKLEKLIHGADHDRNQRAGTENVLEIVGLGKAAEIAFRDLEKNMHHYRTLRDKLEKLLLDKNPQMKINAQKADRLPNTSSVSYPGIEANTLLDNLEDVAASAGAACHTDNIDVSVVLEAMKVPVKFAMGTIRFSVGRGTDEQQIVQAAEKVTAKVRELSNEASDEPLVQTEEIKLTHFTHGLGCACKLRPQDLEEVLKNMPSVTDKHVLVGTDTSDDATVYQINDEQAIVQTLDFFTPIVDDPYDFGAIAAANALSDVYAMGAKPLFALNIVGFPDKRLPMKVLQDILSGAQSVAAEAGISVLGGHTVEDTEPKYGMVVTGMVHPEKVIRNTGARNGDVLVLTKPLGTGILSTATKRGLASPETIATLTKTMKTLNKVPAEIMMEYDVHACTDVTGFGLLGHLKEMIHNSETGFELNKNSIPYLPDAVKFARAGIVPGGTQNNLAFVDSKVIWPETIPGYEKHLLCDAQTSGGLLMALSQAEADQIISQLQKQSIVAGVIGKFTKEHPGKIHVV